MGFFQVYVTVWLRGNERFISFHKMRFMNELIVRSRFWKIRKSSQYNNIIIIAIPRRPTYSSGNEERPRFLCSSNNKHLWIWVAFSV